ncbi:MAG: TolC family protein [Chitinophagaceae bacterium]
MNRLLLNHKNIYSLVLLFCCATAFAQVKTPVTTRKTEPLGSAIRQTDKVFDVREKLVQLALQNPNYEVADRKVAIAGYQVKKAKGSWLSTIAVQGNFNEFAFKGATTGPTGIVTNPSTFYPKYNFGVSLPFNLISDRKNEVKIAKENLSIAEAEKNQRFREIKALVLTKYEDYLLCQQKLDFQSQVTQDARTAYLAAEKDFQEGGIKQEEYNKSYRGYTDEKIKQAEYLRNYNVIKLELESMIGVSMDDLLKK